MTMQTPSTDLVPRHVRAARALLAWSQRDLAKAANVATSTIADFERGSRTPVTNNAHAIRDALETAGIRFLPTGAVTGHAVPTLNQSDRPGTPVRWVTADDLAAWAGRTDGPVSLPTLLAFLVRATHGAAVQLRFPADGGVRHSGWDGLTTASFSSSYVPQGDAGWELSAQRNDVAGKIKRDYEKRTSVSAPLDPASSVCIFVTLHHWAKKDVWAGEMTAAGPWREVRVYDADDLVHWIEQTPAVGLWLANRLGKRPEGTRELDEVWEEWSRATKWPLTADLVLSDRDQDAAEVLRWLRGDPSVLSLQATTAEEVVAFVHAALSELPEGLASAYRARCLVATTAASARALADAPAPLILILTEPDPGLARSIVDKGHFVLLAYDDSLISRGDVRTLQRPSREGIAIALQAAGIAEPRAHVLARDSARNLAVLRRRIPIAPGRLPKWAEEPPPRALLAALLAGGWDENAEADRSRLSQLADAPHDEVIAALTPYVGRFDSPLQKVGATWRLSSPWDAWFLLANRLTSGDLQRFEVAAHAVLGAADPRFDIDPSERWMAAAKGVSCEYSGLIRHGIGQTLILLALQGDQVRALADAGQRANAIVQKLLANADQRRWWSLSRDFRLLAEAAPDVFLAAVEDSLDQNDPPLSSLFAADTGGFLGAEYLADLMWAMEALAWSPELFARVSMNLARLDALDNKPRRFSNGPASSLRKLHLLWNPQTHATLDARLRALDVIRKRESDAAWKLMLGILPQGHDFSTPSPMPRWRDFSVDHVEAVTWSLVGRGASAISQRLLEDVGTDAARWIQVLQRFGDLQLEPEAVLNALDAAERLMAVKLDRGLMWEALRGLLYRNREFPDAKGCLPDSVLKYIENIYDRFAPVDALERIAWLFKVPVQLPSSTGGDWRALERDVELARIEAVKPLFCEGGVVAVLALARLSETAGYLGKAIYDAGFAASEVDPLLDASVRSDDSRERDVAHGIIVSAFRDRGEAWGAELLAKAKASDWGDTAILTILRALPATRWTWGQVEAIGGEIEIAYWRSAPVFWMSDDREDVTYAIRRLIDVGRARHALRLTDRCAKLDLPTGLLIEVLLQAVKQPFADDGDTNETTMFRHYVAEALSVLDERPDVNHNALAMLEWNYLPLLQYSRRPARVLIRALSEQPPLFIQMLSAVFGPSEESGIVEPAPNDPEQARAVASQAYRLLSLWARIPGTRDDGTIDARALENWVKEARSLAKSVGREAIADDQIGNILSASPLGADGNWPAEAVREVLDLFRSKPMLNGFRVGKLNRRGMTSRSPRDGGEQERALSAQYRAWAEALRLEYPRTARALDGLAESYGRDAQREDDHVERLDWEG